MSIKLWGFIGVIVAFVVVVFILSFHQTSILESNKPVVKIGITLPLTGNMADTGISAQKAIDMAFADWQRKETKYRYELVIEDDGFSAKRVAMITNKFVTIDKVNAVLSIYSVGANVISPITDRNKVLHLTCSYGSQPAEGFYNFNHQTQYAEQSNKMLYALKKRGIHSISLFTQNNIGSLQSTDNLVDTIKKDGSIQILSDIKYNPGTREFRLMIHKALSKGQPDIFYIDGLNPDATLFARDLKNITGTLKLTTINEFIEPADKNIFNGLWFIQSAYGTPQFVAKFEEENKTTPFICSANIYDNLNLLIWAFENTGVENGNILPTTDAVVRTLLSVKNWRGATGNISVDGNGIIQSQAEERVIKDGKSVLLEE